MPVTHQLHEFDNGLRLATVEMPHMASVAVGLWTDVGSRHELPREHGMAHFLEHMLFKGTPSRSSEAISRDIESLGASIDGFTVEDHTAYHAKGPAERFDELFDVLADFYQHPTLDPSEIESEKQVIREEIAMVRDQPSQMLEDLLSEAAWGADHPLGRSITGTEESLDGFQRDDVLRFFQRSCCGRNTVVSVAGKLDHGHIRDLVAQALAGMPKGSKVPFTPARHTEGIHRFHEEGDQEQAHLALAFRGVDRFHEDRFAHKLLDVILGENMSSRLFQMIREQKGLCYEVQSDLVNFQDAGLLQIYLALSPGNLAEALGDISRVIDDLRANGVTATELASAKSYLIGQSRIGLENTAAQMMWAGESLLFFDKWVDPETAHGKLEQVTLEEINAVAKVTFESGDFSSALIGPEESKAIFDRWLSVAA